jgi:hypothetical protein
MSGSGRKTWVAGEALGASEVQTYLQDQVVQVYGTSQLRDEFLGANVSDGMVSYTTNDKNGPWGPVFTDIEVRRNGSWEVEKYSNFQGKNYVLNSDLSIWQRGTSFTFTAGAVAAAFTADRWKLFKGTTDAVTVSRVVFPSGEAPLKAYEGGAFIRTQITAATTYTTLRTGVEGVRNLQNKKITISFYAKADAPRSIVVVGRNSFGQGVVIPEFSGNVTAYSQVNLTTSWQRFSVTVFNDGISETFDDTTQQNGYLLDFGFSGTTSTGFMDSATPGIPAPAPSVQTGTFDIWGVQIEESNSPTDFEPNSLDPANETLACNRYYYRATAPQLNTIFAKAIARTTTIFDGVIELPTQMRTAPTAIEIAAVGNYGYLCAGVAGVSNALVIATGRTNTRQVGLQLTSATAATALRNAVIRATTTSAFIGVSSEWF